MQHKYVTLHGKEGEKVNARARVRWYGTLSVSLRSQICAYVISKTKSVTADIVLHAKAFVQSSELFDTLNVPKDTRVKRHACHIACVLRHASKTATFPILYFPISHNALCLPPKFCINYCCEILLGIVYAKFGGQTECIMGNWKIGNSNLLTQRTSFFLVQVEKYVVDNACFSFFYYYYKMNTQVYLTYISAGAKDSYGWWSGLVAKSDGFSPARL